MRLSMIVLVACALGVVSASTLSAQHPDSKWTGYRDVHHRNDCRLAHQVLTHGQPAEKRDWALRVIPTCGPLGGEAIADLLREYADATVRTEEYDRIVLLGARLTDHSIYEAAMALAADPDANELARVQAVRAVYYQLSPGSFDDYESLVTPGVLPFATGTYHSSVGEPLPADAFFRARDAMAAIARDAALAERLRTVADKTRATATARIRMDERCRGVSLQECMRRMGVIPPDP